MNGLNKEILGLFERSQQIIKIINIINPTNKPKRAEFWAKF